MRRISVLWISLAILFLLTGMAASRDRQTLEEVFPTDAEIKQVQLECDLGMSRFSLTAHKAGDIFSGKIRYDADKTEVSVDFDKSGSTADIYLLSERADRGINLETKDNIWNISISTDYVWDINLDLGFAEGRLNLSGLPISRLELDVGASELKTVFKEPNPELMKRFEVDVGAGDIEMIGLGYANFKRFSFDGGAGDFLLNFAGLEGGKRTAEIDIGVGEVRIEIPRGLPVRIRAEDNWLGSIDLDEIDVDQIADGVYETEGFDNSTYGLELWLDIGIGEASIDVID